MRFEQLEPIIPLAWNALGDNIQVSQIVAPERDQVDPVVALSPGQFTDPDFTYVVVWQFERSVNYSQTEVLYRQYRGDGTPVTPERSIFSGVAGNFDAQDPQIAMADDGRFVIAWEETTSGNVQQVYYTLFNANGNPDPNHQNVPVSLVANNSNPDVYFAPDGQYFAITWQTRVSAANRDIYYEFVDLNNLGLPVGAFAAGSATRNEFQPKIAGRKTGATDIATDRVVITWTEGARAEIQGLNVGFNMFDIRNGNPVFGTTQLVTDGDPSVTAIGLNRDQYQPSISADADGNFVIVYTELWFAAGNFIDHDLYFRRYDTDGEPIDVSRRTIDFTTSDINEATVSMAQDGSFVVVYEIHDQLANRVDMRIAGYNSNGSRINTINPIDNRNNSQADNVLQDNPSLHVNNVGNFVVVWGSNVNSRGANSSRPPGGFMDVMSQRYISSPPAAASVSVVSPPVVQSVAPITIEVSLNSAIPIDTATVQSSSLEVTTADNRVLQAAFASLSSNASGTSVVASYRLLPPGGSWDPSDNGNYTVVMPPEQVQDIAGNVVTEQVLTTFDVDITAPDTAPPTVAAFSGVTFAANGTATFSITYEDNVAVHSAALAGNDIRVTGPNGYSQLATLLNVDDLTPGPTRTATYLITAPGGNWTSNANGTYNVNVLAGRIRDTSGNSASAQVAGTFTVDVAPEPTPVSPWHNAALPQDVNNDGRVSSLDALYIINRLNEGRVGSLSVIGGSISGFVDVNNDGMLTPLDALQVINYLNQASAQRQAATAAALPVVQEETVGTMVENLLQTPAVVPASNYAAIAAHAMAIEQEAEFLRTGKRKL